METVNVKPDQQNKDEKKDQVRSMFNRIAPYYDFLNHALSLGVDHRWRRKAIATLKDEDVQLMLDMATGTGDLAFEAHKQLKPEKIVAVDLSSEMLAYGKKKVVKRALDKSIFFELGDSEKILYEDNTFDAISVGFGVRNYENLEKGLKEMYRVLKPGGKVVILEFSKPNVFPIKQMFNLYFKHILPLIGRITSKDKKAYSYLYKSVQAFPDYDQFKQIMSTCGYKNNSWKSLTWGICTIYTGIK